MSLVAVAPAPIPPIVANIHLPHRASAQEHGEPLPRLGAIARRTGLNLAIGCVVPATVFYAVFHVAGVWTAIIATLAWSYGTLAWRALTGRRIPGLLVLTTAVLTGRTALALVMNSAFLYFLQPIIIDMAIATVFLLSLRTGRPLVARIAGDFYPIDERLAARPRIRALFRHLTVLWATLWVTKGVLGLWLLLTQPLHVFIPMKAVAVLIVNVSAMAITIAAAAYVGRREGLVGARQRVS
ncbi:MULTISPECIES: VC0807 family protein [unclassified Nocardioides]|uniref:VC0807 family protein n=1 Tax=unclassified Nocardioides TaxID=2615069 RepID=UPI00361700CA